MGGDLRPVGIAQPERIPAWKIDAKQCAHDRQRGDEGKSAVRSGGGGPVRLQGGLPVHREGFHAQNAEVAGSAREAGAIHGGHVQPHQ
eukprot:5933016-Heterocapsa_arctica.AAC.1